ncbi:hypothetical protein AVEN_126693-1 [Araneus ventricosus]|uniref:Mutator-like transposase domain-containing protein n=1 Tax=Araneus ventricosus TaxID=182803 RepID=A0A4Y2ICP0_ARAVE|nr:hypothetical protein AVEN_126693-1 [Araneus ventricosus]
MPKYRTKRTKNRSFHGNRFTNANQSVEEPATASASKLIMNDFSELKDEVNGRNKLKGNRIMDIFILNCVFSAVCCPQCLKTGLKLTEDSRFGLCSDFTLTCKCGYMNGFTSTAKIGRKSTLNPLLVLGLRLIGKGFTAGKKLLCIVNLPFMSKSTFRRYEDQLLKAVRCAADKNMKEAAAEVRTKTKTSSCGVSVDGTWQRRGHNSLNGCVSAISIDTGKVLDLEPMSLYCRYCDKKKNNDDHVCSNHVGSSASMETVGAYRIFDRSKQCKRLKYTKYYGDGDSNGFNAVKDIYGPDSVEKLECIGHVQKRVGSRLRNLKKKQKGLGGKGKLTDKLIDKLQNYYGIAIRSNIGNLQNMQSAVIAAFYHCCSGKTNKCINNARKKATVGVSINELFMKVKFLWTNLLACQMIS